MYEIQSHSDIQTGVTLTIKIPETELDKKALYTILSDKPDFIIPFHYRNIDGLIEFTYQIGNKSKLAYLASSRGVSDYTMLWTSILQPLLDCDDWFMNPYSFVLKYDYLYCDKNSRNVSFIYIPSVKAYSNYNVLKNMVTEVARDNHVLDISFENRVVWGIQDFNISNFLEVVKSYGVEDIKDTAQSSIPKNVQKSNEQPVYISVNQQEKKQEVKKEAIIFEPDKKTDDIKDDIIINLDSNKKINKKEKKRRNLFGFRTKKQPKLNKKSKNKIGLLDKTNRGQQEIIQGAAATLDESGSYKKDYISVENHIPSMDLQDDVTQLDINESEGPKLYYVGYGDHPKEIVVDISANEIFTIGRFDASVGIKQSNFEFDKKTKAVSRRHAAIERNMDGYNIVDLSSAAGTFLNGQKLHPNAPFKLENGIRISFGNSGADYLWNE